MLTCRAPSWRSSAGDFGGDLVGGAKTSRWSRFLTVSVPSAGTLRNHQVGNDAILGAALRRLEADLILFLPGPAPAQRGLPEAGDPGRVSGVKAQALDAYFHEAIMPR